MIGCMQTKPNCPSKSPQSQSRVQVGLVKGLVYVAAQSAGAVVGAALLRGLVPADSVRGEHCSYRVSHIFSGGYRVF